MTHTKDTERAEFERELIDNHHYVPSDFSFKDGFYGGDDDYIQFGWDIWQAARRAPAVPVPVPECWCETCRPQTLGDMRFIVCPACGNKRCPRASNHIHTCTNSNAIGQKGSSWEHVKPVAAAPQPPECLMSEKRTTKPEAAPVQTPEPLARIEGGSLKWHIPDSRYSLPVRYLQGTHNLYTEHQFRQLLAAHGIQEQST